MNVTATDKGTSKNAKITITNNKGRLSKQDIERLVKQAEKFKDQDQKIRKRVEARNNLEGYCVNVKHTLDDSKLEGKLAPGEKESVMNKVRDIENWMNNTPNAETEEYEAKQKEIERLFNPIATKMYQGEASAEPRCGNSAQEQPSGPMPGVDQVD